MFRFNYIINTDSDDETVVTIAHCDKDTVIKFEGKSHLETAMRFVAEIAMVQMGEIGI